MKKQLLLLLLLACCFLPSSPAYAETQTFSVSERLQPQANQSLDEVRMYKHLRVIREMREKAARFLAQQPGLENNQLEDLVALSIAIFPGEVYDLESSNEVKAKIMIDTSMLPESLEAFRTKDPYHLESIVEHQHYTAKLEQQFADYLNELARSSPDKAQLLRQTQGQQLKNAYRSDRYFVEAAKLFYRSDWRNAARKLDEAVRLNPKYVGNLFLRAIAYFEQKDYDKAIADLSAGIQLEPQNDGLYFMRSVVYLSQGVLLDKSMDDIQKALELNPQNAQAYYVRGILYREKKQCDRAKRDFAKACQLGHEHSCRLDCNANSIDPAQLNHEFYY